MQRRDRTTMGVICLMILMSFIMGFIGFLELEQGQGWRTPMYKALQLFTLESGAIETAAVPLALEIARWLAPVAILIGILQAVMFYLYRRQGSLRARFARNHIVIWGATPQALALAKDIHNEKKKAVIIDSVISDELLHELRQIKGIGFLAGHHDTVKSVRKALALAGITRAARLAIIVKDDTLAHLVALTTAAMINEHGRSTDNAFQISLHITDKALKEALSGDSLSRAWSSKTVVLNIINFEEQMARKICEEYPLDTLKDGETPCRDVHLVLLGLNPLSEALAIHSARTCHFPNGGKAVLHLLGPESKDSRSVLLEKYPNLEKCCQLQVDETTSLALPAQVAQLAIDHPDAAISVVPNLSDESIALTQGLQVLDCLRREEVIRSGEDNPQAHPGLRILIPCGHASPVRSLIQQDPNLLGGLVPMPDIMESCSREVFLGDEADSLAIRFHESWQTETAKREEESKPTLKEWWGLSVAQRNKNRFAADFLMIQVRNAGLTVARLKDEPALWEKIVADSALMETLSRAEHERWCAALWLDGWQEGPRNDTALKHPNLVTYDELDEPTREYDRMNVRLIPSCLAKKDKLL